MTDMPQSDIERVDRLLDADLTYDPDVERKYGEVSRARMRALKARLLEVMGRGGHFGAVASRAREFPC